MYHVVSNYIRNNQIKNAANNTLKFGSNSGLDNDNINANFFCIPNLVYQNFGVLDSVYLMFEGKASKK